MFLLLTVSNNQFWKHECEFLTNIRASIFFIGFFCQKQSDCLKVLEHSGFIVLESIFGSGEQDIGLLTTLSHEFSNCCWQIKQNSFWLIKKLVQIGKLKLVDWEFVKPWGEQLIMSYFLAFLGLFWPFLGMRHDGRSDLNECDPGAYLMSPTLGSGKNSWSTCSRSYLSEFLM